MTYTNRPDMAVPNPVVATPPVVEYHDRVRWGPIFAGIVIAISTQLLLSSLGTAVGTTFGAAAGANPEPVSIGIGIWAIFSLLLSLLIGGWIMASTCGPMKKKTALLNGAILWATTLSVSAWLLASGVSGTFGIVASNAGEVLNQVQESTGLSVPDPNAASDITADQAKDAAAAAATMGWSFIVGSLLGLVAAMIGASVGARKPKYRV